MFKYWVLLELRYGIHDLRYFWYDSMTETIACWLLLVLFGGILGMPGILGNIACGRCF